MYNNQRKRMITLGQKQFLITVDHNRIKSDTMFLNLKRDSEEILQRIHTHNQSMERMKENSVGRVHCISAIGIEIPILNSKIIKEESFPLM